MLVHGVEGDQEAYRHRSDGADAAEKDIVVLVRFANRVLKASDSDQDIAQLHPEEGGELAAFRPADARRAWHCRPFDALEGFGAAAWGVSG
jgi:hypothetical protein